MVLILHIIIALISMVYTGFVFFFPSKTKLNISYVLVSATIMSGAYLTIMNLSHMVSACITGIIYLGFVTAGLALAHKKLASQNA